MQAAFESAPRSLGAQVQSSKFLTHPLQKRRSFNIIDSVPHFEQFKGNLHHYLVALINVLSFLP